MTALVAMIGLGCATIPPSCDDLIDIANGLDDVADYYVTGGTVYEGTRDDVLYGEVVDELERVANVENDAQISASIRTMAYGYDAFDGVRFEEGLEATIFRIDQLYDRDCR
jgi:hypothetical protein